MSERIIQLPSACNSCKISCINWRNYSAESWLGLSVASLKPGENLSFKAFSLKLSSWLDIKIVKSKSSKNIIVTSSEINLQETYKFKEAVIQNILEKYLLVIPHQDFGRVKRDRPLCVLDMA